MSKIVNDFPDLPSLDPLDTKLSLRPTLRPAMKETNFQLKSSQPTNGPQVKTENTLLFPGMDDDTMSESSAMTRDEQGEPLAENIQWFGIQKQELGKQLVTSAFGQMYKLWTSLGGLLKQPDSNSSSTSGGGGGMCCNIDPTYVQKYVESVQSLAGK